MFENAPLPHVLRINAQISLEYKDSDCFAHLCASTDATDGAANFAEAYLIPPAAQQELAARQESASRIIRLGGKRAENKRARALAYQLSQQPYWLRCALSRVKHLVVYKDGTMSDHGRRLYKFVDEITKMISGLLTVKIALKVVNLIDKLWHLELIQGKVKDLATTLGYYVPSLPDTIADFSLLQRADSYRLKPGKFVPVDWVHWSHKAYPYVISDRAHVGYHMPVVSAVFLYGVDNVHKKHFWNPQQVIDLWPISGNLALTHLFDYKSDEEAELTNNLPLWMLGWTEERKDAAAKGVMERNYGAEKRAGARAYR
jgi:hypothetical protein